MIRSTVVMISALFLAACTQPQAAVETAGPTAIREVQLLALNDFHGNLEAPGQHYEGSQGRTPVGGIAYLATALREARTPASVTVAAGDMIGASPLVSSLFYDEPTIEALTLVGLDLSSVGNHEFDRGAKELLRMQFGGCLPEDEEDFRISCPTGKPFAGAGFRYLAANVLTEAGSTLLPSAEVRKVGGVKIGFIGMTLQNTGALVSPAGVAGLTFLDEAATANALVPTLKAAGAETIVLLIHEGGAIEGLYDDKGCPGLSGPILDIAAKLDTSIRTVVTGHTHQAYLCNVTMPEGGDRLITSSGRYGGLVADIRLTFGPEGLRAQDANFIEVQGEAVTRPGREVALNANRPLYIADPELSGLVARYRDMARPIADRPVGNIPADLLQRSEALISPAAMFIADSMLHVAGQADKGDADFALMNVGGARAELAKGAATFGDLYRMQPFANSLVTRSFTGAEVRAVLEQMFDSGTNTPERPMMLLPSSNVEIRYDISRPTGQRIVSVTVDGKRLVDEAEYRVVSNNFLMSGGDNFTAFQTGRNSVDGGGDIDASIAYIRAGKLIVPTTPRVIAVN